MDNLIRKKVILCLLDCGSRSANEIADEIGESLAAIENQLTRLVSENTCEKVNQDESSQYNVKKDIETFAQLVKEFLPHNAEHKEQLEGFITSEYYFSKIDIELVDYVLGRFSLDSVYQSNEEKLQIRKILRVSPSALIFVLYGDKTIFHEMLSSMNQLDSSEETREWFFQILHSQLMKPLLEMLIDDMEVPIYISLYAKLELRVAQVGIEVRLATPRGRYVEAVAGGNFVLYKAAEALRPGQLTSAINPMIFSENGLAFLQLGDFRTALDNFDEALNAVQNPIQKATVLNNKGLAFFNFRQYQKAIESFEEGIALDSDGDISELRENKQLAEEYLARATDADNLTEPTQIRFVQDQPVPFEETRLYEFKEVKGRNPVDSITKISDKYAVAFLNSEGGRIFWGIRDSDRITVGVTLDERQRDDVRRKISEKLGAIQPSIVGHCQLELHPVYDLQGETIEDLWIIELLVPSPRRREVFYTSKGELHVKTEGGKKKLLGPAVTEFIRRHFQNDTETS